MVKIEVMMKDDFMRMVANHGNGRWATNELEYKVKNENWYDYHNCDHTKKFQIDMYLKALRCLFGEKDVNDL